jgi:long-chain acyl-CoA synthetase
MFSFFSLKPMESALLLFIRCVLSIYTFITWPIYYIIQKPWNVKANRSKLRVSKLVEPQPVKFN